MTGPPSLSASIPGLEFFLRGPACTALAACGGWSAVGALAPPPFLAAHAPRQQTSPSIAPGPVFGPVFRIHRVGFLAHFDLRARSGWSSLTCTSRMEGFVCSHRTGNTWYAPTRVLAPCAAMLACTVHTPSTLGRREPRAALSTQACRGKMQPLAHRCSRLLVRGHVQARPPQFACIWGAAMSSAPSGTYPNATPHLPDSNSAACPHTARTRTHTRARTVTLQPSRRAAWTYVWLSATLKRCRWLK